MEKSNTSRIITASLVGLLAICLTWLVIVWQSNSSLNGHLAKQKLKVEALLSEKLLVQKDFDKSKDSITRLEKQKAELDELLEYRTEMLTTQTLENKKIKKALRFAEEQYKTESTSNKELREKLSAKNVSFSALDSQSKTLSDSLHFLRGENAYLKHELNEAIIKTIDQTLISGVKRNNAKVTSKARATKKLIAHVEVPGKLDDLHFTMEGPNGDVISGAKGAISARTLKDDNRLTASTNDKIYNEVKSQNIEIVYIPDERLKTGTYTLKIFNDNNYVGSMKVKLR